jgi:hypothetical protein
MNRRYLVLLAFSTPLACLAVQVPSTADAHLSATAPAANFGALPQLSIGNGSVALINFDLGPLPPLSSSSSVGKATLIVYVNRALAAGRLDVMPVLAPWTESGVSRATQPALGAVAANSDVITQGNTVLRIDITAQFKSWIDAPATAYGVALRANAADPGSFVLDSKENTTTSQPAHIEVSLVPVAGQAGGKGDTGDIGLRGPQGTAGPAGAPGLAGQQGLPGVSGLAGGTGATGAKGPRGDSGNPGAIGAKGEKGPVGKNGPRGSKGEPGPLGNPGPVGPQGFGGAQGTQGPQGPTGNQGSQGPTGLSWYYLTTDAGKGAYHLSATCPIGFVAISGACGHRDANSASNDIILNYYGPDFGNIRTWRCWIENTNSSSRSVRYGVLCSTASAGVTSADGKSALVQQLTEELGLAATVVKDAPPAPIH